MFIIKIENNIFFPYKFVYINGKSLTKYNRNV